MFSGTALDEYDPALADYYGYDCSLTKDERKILADLHATGGARKLISCERYVEATSVLREPIEAQPLPDILSMRATCYLRTNEFVLCGLLQGTYLNH